MTTTTEYRAMAEECFQWAREATTHNTRSAYLKSQRYGLQRRRCAKIVLTLTTDGRSMGVSD
jgi:hypothetical protein